MACREKKTLKKEVYNTIKKYELIKNGDKLVLGISGGPDSMTMLDILFNIKEEKSIKFDFVVAHLNHKIRQEAQDDEKYVEKYCQINKIDFYSKSIDVKKMANNNKVSTEEAGRDARYTFFDEIQKKVGANKIAIAHNKNDKIETIIMNELRGCGIAGLKGIEPKRDKYIRPLIEIERNQIEEYCEEKDLNPRIDKTNFENIYTRNKIRNVVIPYIKQEFNPNIIRTIDRLSNLVVEQEEYINKQTKEIYANILEEEKLNEYIVLNLKKFNEQENVIKSNIILYTIARICKTTKGIEKIHIEDIIKLCKNNVGNKFLRPNKNLKVFVKKGKIKFSREYE